MLLTIGICVFMGFFGAHMYNAGKKNGTKVLITVKDKIEDEISKAYFKGVDEAIKGVNKMTVNYQFYMDENKKLKYMYIDSEFTKKEK